MLRYALWPVLRVLKLNDKNNLEMKTPVLRASDSGNLKDKIGHRRLAIILSLSDLKSVGSREQAVKDSIPRPIPNAFLRRLVSGVVFQYLASKGGKRHLARHRKN
jgi:hypothetical protein